MRENNEMSMSGMENAGGAGDAGGAPVRVGDFAPGGSFSGRYAVRRVDAPREYRAKPGRFLMFTVGDSTGNVSVKLWGGPVPDYVLAVHERLAPGTVVELSGRVEEDPQTGEPVAIIREGQDGLRPLAEGEYDPSEFLPRSDADADGLFGEVRELASGVQDGHLRRLLDDFLDDDDFARAFKSAPSAIMHHHNYVGGLLEHTWGVARLCDRMAAVQPELDRDVLVAGAILHDVGKVRSFVCSTSIDMSGPGQFVGHVVLSDRMVRERISGIEGFPEQLALKLEHLILSHHAAVEPGSFRQLRTPEACALHFADTMDAQVKEFLQARSEADSGEGFAYSRRLGGTVYVGS